MKNFQPTALFLKIKTHFDPKDLQVCNLPLQKQKVANDKVIV